MHSSSVPSKSQQLFEFYEIFKNKAATECWTPPIISIRLSYELKDFPNASFCSKRKFAFYKSSNDPQKSNEEFSQEKTPILPFGVSIDPVSELILYCTWPEITENYITLSKTFSDFDAMTAPQWSFRLLYEPIPLCFMSECLQEFIKISSSSKTLAEILGREYTYSGPADYALQEEINPLERLTESKIAKLTSSFLGLSFTAPSTSVKKIEVKKPKAVKGPISEECLMEMLYYMFPDADDNKSYTYDIPDSNAV